MIQFPEKPAKCAICQRDLIPSNVIWPRSNLDMVACYEGRNHEEDILAHYRWSNSGGYIWVLIEPYRVFIDYVDEETRIQHIEEVEEGYWKTFMTYPIISDVEAIETIKRLCKLGAFI